MKKRITFGKRGFSRRRVLGLFAATAGGAILAGCKRILTQPTPEAIEIVEAPHPAIEFEGPVYTGTGAGYIIEFEKGTKFYFSGDTCLFWDMKFAIGDYYHPDVAFLPIGDLYTMDARAGAYATTLVNPRYAIPYHYHTFPELTQDATEFVAKVTEYREKGETRAEAIVLEPGVAREVEGIKVLWLGHASFLFESPSGTTIMIDPWLEANPDCPAQYKKVAAFEGVDLVLLTHGHVDHVTFDELDRVWQLFKPVIIAQWELGIFLQYKMTAPVALINKGGSLTKERIIAQEIVTDVDMIKEDLVVTMVQADHSSSPP